MPAKKRSSSSKTDLPSTLERSPKKAQETWQKTHDSAVEEYGEGERAHRTAFASLKHSYEKVGDHWEEKDSKGPSDAQAARGGADARRTSGRGDTAGGVNANASKKHLYDIAQRLEVRGRSQMSKDELVEAIQRANDRSTAKARKSSS
ncbi:ChaB family protein [Terrabacter sp. NPDC080008]|uniref:ChaB family protein n=1 Tax=Terrabacter sp. NPDC080008 TaxID=3155176 RepID=UPI00344EA2FD